MHNLVYTNLALWVYLGGLLSVWTELVSALLLSITLGLTLLFKQTCWVCWREWERVLNLFCCCCEVPCFASEETAETTDSFLVSLFCLFSSLDRHMQTHHGHHKPFRCKLCPFKSSYNSRLKTHILKAHAGKFFPSQSCSVAAEMARVVLVADQRCWVDRRVLSPELGKIFFQRPPSWLASRWDLLG